MNQNTHCCSNDTEHSQANSQDNIPVGAKVFHIPSMDCASEESEIRHAVANIAGIRSLNFQLAERTLAIDASDEALQQALVAIRAAGFDPQLINATESSIKHTNIFNDDLWRPMIALAIAVGTEMLAVFVPATMPFKLLTIVLAATSIALAGFVTYKKGLDALKRARLNINALMSVAVTGAFLIGQWPEAAMVMALFAIAELIEARSVDRARNAIKGLLDMTPDTAEVQLSDGSWQTMLVTAVALDSIVRVKPGGRVPLDGVVTAGASVINQAPVTGESIPVDKTINDLVFAGTINETSTLEFRVTAVASNSTLSRIIYAVEQAQGMRAPTQRFVDRFASIYTPTVFVIAVAVAILMPWLMGWTWTQALYKALVLLVIACPCALVISTPVTVVSGLAAAARRGILVKGGVYLEGAHKIRAIALDKTGTITEGKPKLVAVEILDNTIPETQTKKWAASLATYSDHPVSKAIAQGLEIQNDPFVDNFTALHGRGVQGLVDGEMLVLGNHRLIEERKQCSAYIETQLAIHETAGRTVTMLASSNRVLAIFAVADTIKESSREAIAELHQLGVASIMLTGDNNTTARTIATQAGIDDARGNLLPEDKLVAIEELQGRYGVVAMTGDGINDAPALARADIGVAMGAAGTDTAMEAADVVIMNDDLRRIPELIFLSRRTRAILWQNISLALGIKVLFLILALFGNATMWMAVFADMGASLLVVFNGLRLLR